MIQGHAVDVSANGRDHFFFHVIRQAMALNHKVRALESQHILIRAKPAVRKFLVDCGNAKPPEFIGQKMSTLTTRK